MWGDMGGVRRRRGVGSWRGASRCEKMFDSSGWLWGGDAEGAGEGREAQQFSQSTVILLAAP